MSNRSIQYYRTARRFARRIRREPREAVAHYFKGLWLFARRTRWEREAAAYVTSNGAMPDPVPPGVIPSHLVTSRSIALPLPFAKIPESSPQITVLCHIYYTDICEEIKSHLSYIPAPFRTCISTDSVAKRDFIARAFADWPCGPVDIRITPNVGRDTAPRLVTFADVYDQSDLMLHIGTKKSLHNSNFNGWRKFLFTNVMGSPQIVQSILHIFATQPKIGMITPQHFEPVLPWCHWTNNFPMAYALARAMEIKLAPDMELDFPEGMFWTRGAALRPLLDLQLTTRDFGIELGKTDGTLYHAIERLYFPVLKKAGYSVVKITCPDLYKMVDYIEPIGDQAALDNFCATIVRNTGSVSADCV